MATSFTPHPLFISNPLSIPTSRPSSVAVPPPQPPYAPPQPAVIATRSSELQSQQPPPVVVVQHNEVDFSLTRRFGLAWAGFLVSGVVSQQEDDTRRDVEKAEEVTLPNGIRYYELRIGRGATPRRGDLVITHLKGRIKDKNNDALFVNTCSGENKRTIAIVMGSRPYTRGMCEGIEYVLMTMKGGGKRRVIIPPNLGFGDKGADFGLGLIIPPSSTLEYIVEVDKVSITPPL